MSGSNDLMIDEEDIPVYEIREFLGDNCQTSSVTGRLSISSHTYGGKTSKSLEGCIHICDGSSLASWSFYDGDKNRLQRTAKEFRRIAVIFGDIANAIDENADKVGEFEASGEQTV